MFGIDALLLLDRDDPSVTAEFFANLPGADRSADSLPAGDGSAGDGADARVVPPRLA